MQIVYKMFPQLSVLAPLYQTILIGVTLHSKSIDIFHLV